VIIITTIPFEESVAFPVVSSRMRAEASDSDSNMENKQLQGKGAAHKFSGINE
jgi:hypothetical protein